MAYWLTRILTLSFVVAGGHVVFLATRALLTGADVPGGLPSHLSIEWALFYLLKK